MSQKKKSKKKQKKRKRSAQKAPAPTTKSTPVKTFQSSPSESPRIKKPYKKKCCSHYQPGESLCKREKVKRRKFILGYILLILASAVTYWLTYYASEAIQKASLFLALLIAGVLIMLWLILVIWDWLVDEQSIASILRDRRLRSAMRKKNNVQPACGLVEDTLFNHKTKGSYGFDWYLYTGESSEKPKFHLECSTMNIEYHHLKDGKLHVLGYVGNEAKNAIELNQPIDCWVFLTFPYEEKDHTAKNLVSIPVNIIKSMKQSHYSKGSSTYKKAYISIK